MPSDLNRPKIWNLMDEAIDCVVRVDGLLLGLIVTNLDIPDSSLWNRMYVAPYS
jgi:hypothetical protein